MSDSPIDSSHPQRHSTPTVPSRTSSTESTVSENGGSGAYDFASVMFAGRQFAENIREASGTCSRDRISPVCNLARRHFLATQGISLGAMALGSLLAADRTAAQDHANWESTAAGQPLARKCGHVPARAKAVIQLFMAGAPSQLELFDHKPQLAMQAGQPLPPGIIGDQRYAFIRPDALCLGPQFSFGRHGQSGIELSEMLPHLARVADDLCVIKSLQTDQFNHAPAQIFLNTGFAQPGRPSLGAWVNYGLGSDSCHLPAFVVMSTGAGISGGAANWSSGFLSTRFAGVRLRNTGDSILNVSLPAGIDRRAQRETLDTIQELNRQRLSHTPDPDLAARIANYELAFALQTSAPELMDLHSETRETLELYGANPEQPSFARACLMARRMVERGVRFVSIYHEGWDAHSDVVGNTRRNCLATDQASAALVMDLKRRGLLDETLVIWGGEFGRTPMIETNPALGRRAGRDHHPQAFTMWLAGGGVRAGLTYGQTDDFGFHVIDRPVPVHDLQATVLHCLGLDHERLTYEHLGRRFRLTDVHGRVVTDLLA